MQCSLLHCFVFFTVLSSAAKWRLCNASSSPISKTITVARHGGDYTKISEAIAKGVPVNNAQWIKIHISPGKYNEQVRIPADKPYIILEGAGSETTTVTFSVARDIRQATIIIEADNIVVRGLTFKNSYNLDNNRNRRAQAVAVRVFGDKVSFHECRFRSVQDTVLAGAGRHLFNRCYIEGAIDFIFGNGQSVFENCDLNVTGSGYITAHGRDRKEDTTAFVLKNCRVFGSGKTYLGRGWKSYSRVIFYRTKLSNIVVPEGWVAWHAKEEEVTFAEADCNGPGSDTSRRVKWEKKLNTKEMQHFISPSFNDADGWVEQQP